MGAVLLVLVAMLAGWIAERRGHNSTLYGTVALLLVTGTTLLAARPYWQAEEEESLGRAATGRAPREIQFDYTWPVVGALGGLAMALALPNKARRKCPHCAEQVKIEATVCRYCQRELPAITARAGQDD